MYNLSHFHFLVCLFNLGRWQWYIPNAWKLAHLLLFSSEKILTKGNGQKTSKCRKSNITISWLFFGQQWFCLLNLHSPTWSVHLPEPTDPNKHKCKLSIWHITTLTSPAHISIAPCFTHFWVNNVFSCLNILSSTLFKWDQLEGLEKLARIQGYIRLSFLILLGFNQSFISSKLL